jgi:signal transduction histidine kinase
MKLCVFSRNLKLFDLCSDVVRGLSLLQCEVVRVDPDQQHDEPSDLLIWDLDDVDWAHRDSGSISQRPPQAQVFVIGRKQVGEFLRTLPLGAGSTLLKPVNRAALQIFVEQAAVQFASQRSSQPAGESFAAQDDRPDLLQCLLTANLKLQEYDQDRTNFLARAVHDFRAPLMAASGYCGLLVEGALGPLNGDQLESLQRMQHSLKKLTRMASAMFQLSVGRQVERMLDI